jgi:hypothetical protein
MALDASIVAGLVQGSAKDAWRTIIERVLYIASKPLSLTNAPSEVIKREREIGLLDQFVSSAAWDLWQDFGDSVERNSARLARWWAEPYSAKAILILDGLSLRELPWILQGAAERGFAVHEVSAFGSELPGETTEFAKALGLGSRSQLQNNGGGKSHRLQPTATESVDMPWKDCEGLVNSSKNWLFWHHWPDSKVHDGAVAGQGLDTLSRDAADQLNNDDFWSFVERLATGRRLIITSDHGYAATGYFADADGDVGTFLKSTFSSGRSARGGGESGPFVPPVVMQIAGPNGNCRLAVGRWKWKSPGGYPTMTHGGLSILEVLSPFVELTK